MANQTIDVETIDILLIGGTKEITEAVRLIDSQYREKIVGVICKIALSADLHHDVADIYQNVMLSILERATSRSYDPDAENLEGLICRIARCRAIDWVREKTGSKEVPSTDFIMDSAQRIISGSRYNELWQKARVDGKRNFVLSAVTDLLPTLKHRQRQVAEIVHVNIPNFLADAAIKAEILQRYGEDVTTIAVKRARQEVYSKIKEVLSIAGYGDYTDEPY